MANQDHGECYQAMTGDYHGLQPQSSPAYPGDSSIHHLEEKVQDSGIYRNGVCEKKDCYQVGGFRGTSFCRECYEKFKQELFRSDRAHRENSQVNMPSSIPSVSAASRPRQDASILYTKPSSPRSGVVSPPPSYSTLPTHIPPSPHTGSRWQERSLPAVSPYQEHPREPMRGRYISAPPVGAAVCPTSAQPIRAKTTGERREVKGGGDRPRLGSPAGGRQGGAGSRAPTYVQSQTSGDIGQDQSSAAYLGYPAEDPGDRKLCRNPYCSNFADPDRGGFCFPCFWIQHEGRETGPREGHLMHETAGCRPANVPRYLPSVAHRQDNITVTSDPPTPVHVDVYDNQFTFNTYIHPSAFTPSMWVPNPGVLPHVVRSSIPAIQGPLTEPLVRFPSFGESEFETGGERVFSGREKELLSWNTSAMGREDYV
uniref:Uncharacterized protein n=1 Tax=Branchiostoma floridae TaxID=7739 RepID=C3YXE7_BRAFL|eukprot:XP_002599153.1 hypothetical protein BRAFLDRAFT_81821 [Branchiostoma floridae]